MSTREIPSRRMLVPLSLEKVNPAIYRMALGAANQVQADRYIRFAIPSWRGVGEPQEPDGWSRADRPVNGEYSLAQCEGGAQYHRATRDRRGILPLGERNTLAMRVSVEAPHEPARPHLPRGTRRLAGNNGGVVLP